MYYYKGCIYLMLFANAYSFVTLNKLKNNILIDNVNLNRKSVSNDYLSYIKNAPPFTPTPPAPIKNPEISKTTGDYLSYIKNAPPFSSTKKPEPIPPTPTKKPEVSKTTGDYLSNIENAPPFSSTKKPEISKTTGDYLSNIKDAPPFSSTKKPEISKTTGDYLSNIKDAPPFSSTKKPSQTPPTPIKKPDVSKTTGDYLSNIENTPPFSSIKKPEVSKTIGDYLSNIENAKPPATSLVSYTVKSNDNDYVSSIYSSVSIPNGYSSNNYQDVIKLPEYMYNIDNINKELGLGINLISELIDCIGEKFAKETNSYFKNK